MKKMFSIFFFFCAVYLAQGQNIERKIVVQNKHYYYATVDAEFQMATLYSGNYWEPLKSVKKLAVPAGRNYNEPINPFSWDVYGKNMYAVNFINHPLNDRNEALKRIPIASLQEWNKDMTMPDLIMKSADQNTFTTNDPYMSVTAKSKTLSNFFFDAIALNDSSFYMAITNNDEFCLWNYNGKEWKHGKTIAFKTDGFFTLFIIKNQLYMVTSDGQINKLETDAIVPVQKSGAYLSNGFLIINKDDNTVKFMKNNQLDSDTPLNEQVKKKATDLF